MQTKCELLAVTDLLRGYKKAINENNERNNFFGNYTNFVRILF